MAVLAASSRLENPTSRTSGASLCSDDNTTFDATNMPSSEPMGLNDCDRLRRRVAVSLLPNESMNGLEVVSRNANPKVSTYSDTQKNENC